LLGVRDSNKLGSEAGERDVSRGDLELKKNAGRPSGELSPDELRDQFVGWQCRLRQLAVRQDGGRPSAGMKPRVSEDKPGADGGFSGPSGQAEGTGRTGRTGRTGFGDLGTPILDQLVVLIIEREPEETTAHLHHLCRRTQDPRDRYNQVLSLLRAGYYQYPKQFSDAMTALFSPDSEVAASLSDLGRCVLNFEQYSQAYRVPCAVQPLAQEEAAYQATFYQVAAFNPTLPPNAKILVFTPDWSRAASWQANSARE